MKKNLILSARTTGPIPIPIKSYRYYPYYPSKESVTNRLHTIVAINERYFH